MSTAILFFLVTAGASVVGAISGIGGGIIIKPLLELVTSEPVEAIAFLSGCTVLSMAIVSLLRRRREISAGFELRRGTLLAIGSAVGGVLGKLLFVEIRNAAGSDMVGISQSVVLALMAVFLMVHVLCSARIRARDMQSGAVCAALGAGLGLLSAFLGIGGGPLNLAALSFFLSMDNKRASLHSIYIILFSQAASLLMTFAQRAVPDVPHQLLLTSILGGVSGALIGSALVAKMTNKTVGYLYWAILAFVLIMALLNLHRYLA